MPIYEYICNNCGEKFEFLLRGQEKPFCPKCNSSDLAKQLSLPVAHTAASNRSDSCPLQSDGSCGCCPGAQQGFCPE